MVRCCDCKNQGTDIRYRCSHSGGLVPIECDRFEAKNQCQYCKHWSYIDRDFGQCTFADYISAKGFGCDGFEVDWISIKDKLPERGTYIKVRNHNGHLFSEGKVEKFYEFRDGNSCGGISIKFEDGKIFFASHWQPLAEKEEKDCYNCENWCDDKGCLLFQYCVNSKNSYWKPMKKKPKEVKRCKNCENGITNKGCPFFEDCNFDNIDAYWKPIPEKEKRNCYNCKNEVVGGLCQFFQDCNNLDYWKPIPEKEKEEKGCKNCENGASLWCPYLEGCIHNGIEVYWKPIPEKEKEERADFFFASRGKGDNFLSLWYGEKEYQFPTCGGWNGRVNLMRLLDWLNECLSTRDIE